MSKYNFKSATFRKIFLSYNIIMIIPILIFSTLNIHKNITEEKEIINNKHAADAKRIAENIDDKLKEFKNLGESMSNKTWVRKLMINENIYADEFDLFKDLEIRKEIESNTAQLGIASFAALIYPEKNMIVTQWGTYEIDYFFKNIARVDQEQLYNMWEIEAPYNFFKVLPPIKLSLWNNEERVIPVSQSLEVVNNPRAALVVFINTSYFESFIRRINGTGPLNIYIFDGEGNLYSEINNDFSQSDSEKIRSFVIQSQISKWKYRVNYLDDGIVSIIPKMFTSLLAIGISLILGVSMSLFLSKVSYQPLYALINRISSIRRSSISNSCKLNSEYNIIENSVAELVKENTSLQEAIKNYESAAKCNMLLNLLKGYFKGDNSIERLKEFGLKYDDNMFFCTILVNIDYVNNLSEIDKIKKKEIVTLIAAEKVISKYSISYELFEVTSADKAIILSSESQFDCDRVVKKIAEEVLEELKKICAFKVDVLWGNVERGLLGISKSYYIANERLQYALFSKNNLHKIQDREDEDIYYYPTDWEVQLINNLKIGNLDTVVHILDEIKSENYGRRLSEGCMTKMVSLIMETMVRVLNELNIDTGIYVRQFEGKARVESIDILWNYIYEVGSLICERTKYSNTSSTIQTGNKLLAYINNNFTDCEMSLKKLGEEFKMSSSNISKIFKEVTGINFYDYLCRLRMETAKELLRDKDMEISNVAGSVGYENVYSFKRAFARYEGIKPDEYCMIDSNGNNN